MSPRVEAAEDRLKPKLRYSKAHTDLVNTLLASLLVCKPAAVVHGGCREPAGRRVCSLLFEDLIVTVVPNSHLRLTIRPQDGQ